MRNWSLGGSVLMETQSGGLEGLMLTEKVRYHFFSKKNSSFPSNNGQRLHCNFEFKHSEKDK